MKIVVTNESGLTDRHLEELRLLGEVETYTDTNPENIVARLAGADIAVVDCYLTPVTKELLAQLPDLRFFSINSTGYDKVDTGALQVSGKVASNVPGFSTEAVAEMAIGLMFAIVRKIPEGDREFRAGLIAADPGTPAAIKYQGFDFKGKTLGVVGLGAIGTRVAEMGRGLGMKVVGYNRSAKSLDGVQMLGLDELLIAADVVCICLALNSETKGLISRTRISLMKKTAVFVSIAGIAILDKEALVEALDAGEIAGVAMDTGDHSMVGTKNTVLTPHIAYDTRESAENMGNIILENIQNFVQGSPINTI